MKLLLLFAVVALASAAPKDAVENQPIFNLDGYESFAEKNSPVVNILVRQFFNIIRDIIRHGRPAVGIPVMDPLYIKEYNLKIPTGLLNLDLDLKDVHATGFGDFVVNKSDLDLRTLTFDIEISFPAIHAEAGLYDLVGDVFTAIPLYGKGGAVFKTDGFKIRGLLFLKQSEDGRSILIDRIENAGFSMPHFKSHLDGVIGGGDIDTIVNAVIEEVVIDYANRFYGAIAKTVAEVLPGALNPVLDRLDTWIFIAPLIPRQ